MSNLSLSEGYCKQCGQYNVAKLGTGFTCKVCGNFSVTSRCGHKIPDNISNEDLLTKQVTCLVCKHTQHCETELHNTLIVYGLVLCITCLLSIILIEVFK